jgi:hypothetical protein
VLTGTNTYIKARACSLIATPERWADLWLRHTGQNADGMYAKGRYKFWNNPGGVPVVDFTRCVVVALIQGPGVNSEGLDVAEVVNDGDTTLLRLAEKWYQSTDTAHPVAVYGFFVMPRSNKALVVEENIQRAIGQSPDWKERGRFAKTGP